MPSPTYKEMTASTKATGVMASSAVIRKLRVGGGVGAVLVLLVPLINLVLDLLGAPALDSDDTKLLADVADALWVALGVAVTWFASYRARPSLRDVPTEG